MPAGLCPTVTTAVDVWPQLTHSCIHSEWKLASAAHLAASSILWLCQSHPKSHSFFLFPGNVPGIYLKTRITLSS
jgi:hypothetical protein